MAGTKEGAQKASKTIRERHGEDYFARIGRKGGVQSVFKGYSMDLKKVSRCGKKGAKVKKKIKRLTNLKG